MKCERDTIHNMSEYCLTAWETGSNLTDGCFQDAFGNIGGIIYSIWCFTNALVGFTGNILTLIAIPYAAKKKRFNLHINWSTTAFILNLAFADILYCVFNLSILSSVYLRKRWDWGEVLCKIHANVMFSNAYSGLFSFNTSIMCLMSRG